MVINPMMAFSFLTLHPGSFLPPGNETRPLLCIPGRFGSPRYRCLLSATHGSISNYQELEKIASKLEFDGHEV